MSEKKLIVPTTTAADRTVPPHFMICPITSELMLDPVLLSVDGISYERYIIEKWLANHATSPITRQYANISHLFPNRALHEAITDFRKLNKMSIPSTYIYNSNPSYIQYSVDANDIWISMTTLNDMKLILIAVIDKTWSILTSILNVFIFISAVCACTICFVGVFFFFCLCGYVLCINALYLFLCPLFSLGNSLSLLSFAENSVTIFILFIGIYIVFYCHLYQH